MEKLKEAWRAFSSTILPEHIPPKEVVPASIQSNEMVQSRQSLAGGLARHGTGAFLLFTPGDRPDLSNASKKIPITLTGDPADSKDYTDTERHALGISDIMLNVLSPTDGSASSSSYVPHQVAGLPAKITAIPAPCRPCMCRRHGRRWS